LLTTHVILAIGMLPMIAITLLAAYQRQWEKHRAIAPPTFWIWFYVSVTGVIVYLFLYKIAPAMYPGTSS
jgi:putative membrane protein